MVMHMHMHVCDDQLSTNIGESAQSCDMDAEYVLVLSALWAGLCCK